jgi:UDP-glucose 4-epimerase
MLHRTDGEVFNIGSGNGLTVNEVYKAIASALEFNQPPVYEEAVSGELRNSIADNTKAKKAIDFRPQHSFADSIAAVLSGIGGS